MMDHTDLLSAIMNLLNSGEIWFSEVTSDYRASYVFSILPMRKLINQDIKEHHSCKAPLYIRAFVLIIGIALSWIIVFVLVIAVKSIFF
jgi:hypothetical protein